MRHFESKSLSDNKLHHNSKSKINRYLPKGTVRGEVARNIAVDVPADIAFTGSGYLAGRLLSKNPKVRAMTTGLGVVGSHVIPNYINAKRILEKKASPQIFWNQRKQVLVNDEKIKTLTPKDYLQENGEQIKTGFLKESIYLNRKLNNQKEELCFQ